MSDSESMDCNAKVRSLLASDSELCRLVNLPLLPLVRNTAASPNLGWPSRADGPTLIYPRPQLLIFQVSVRPTSVCVS
jgi:hypothetical protein